MARTFELITPLGTDVLLFHRMHAREELSRLSEFQIDALSIRGDINLDEILGKNVTVKVELPEDKIRYFSGYVTRFAQIGMRGRYHSYHATVRPWLWFLTRTTNCRIFQNMTVPDIIKEIFDEHPQIINVKKELTGTYRKREYCVQYRETEFNFVSRLMEQEGIYYYFKHTNGQHTLVLADSYTAHSPFEGYAKIPFIPQDRVTRIEYERISEWNFAHEIQPGSYVIDDYDFQKPNVELLCKTTLSREHALGDYEVYDYPGEYVTKSEGDEYVRTRIEELQTQFELANGNTNARGLCCGHLFKLTGHPRGDQNCEYLVVSAVHNLEYNEYEAMENTGANYKCEFTVISSRQPFRPQRTTPRPFVQGPQTAIVVGPSGDEIYTDKYGRIKVQFHWDRYGKLDENSSCWIRVSQVHAGKGFGGTDLPRIGEEVIVSFEEGIPDRPLITGRVYNEDNKPPNEFPASKMISGLKSNSTPGGGGNNSIMLNDTKGKEQLAINGQHNMDTTVGNDQTNTINNNQINHVNSDRSSTIAANDTVKVGSNKKVDIGSNLNELVGGKQSSTVGGKKSEMVGGSSTVTVAGKRSESVGGGHTFTNPKMAMNVGGKFNLNAGGSITESSPKVNFHASSKLTANSAGPMNVKAGGVMKQESGGAFNIKSKAALKSESSGAYSIKAGGALKQQGSNITLKGPTKVAGKTKITDDTKIKGNTLVIT